MGDERDVNNLVDSLLNKLHSGASDPSTFNPDRDGLFQKRRRERRDPPIPYQQRQQLFYGGRKFGSDAPGTNRSQPASPANFEGRRNNLNWRDRNPNSGRGPFHSERVSYSTMTSTSLDDSEDCESVSSLSSVSSTPKRFAHFRYDSNDSSKDCGLTPWRNMDTDSDCESISSNSSSFIGALKRYDRLCNSQFAKSRAQDRPDFRKEKDFSNWRDGKQDSDTESVLSNFSSLSDVSKEFNLSLRDRLYNKVSRPSHGNKTETHAFNSSRQFEGQARNKEYKTDRTRPICNFSESSRQSDEKSGPAKTPYKKTYVISDSTNKKSESAKENERGTIFVGFKYLKELSEKEPPQITCEILKTNTAFTAFIEKRDLQPDWLFLLVKIVAKACSSEFVKTRNEMLNRICLNSEFLFSISFYLGEVSVETRKSTIQNFPSFIESLVEIYSCLIDSLPRAAINKDLPKLVTKTRKAVEHIKVDHGIIMNDKLISKLDMLDKKIEDHMMMLEKPQKPVAKKNYLQYLSELPPPNDFRELSLYPTYEDLTRHSFDFVRPNKVKGAYDNVEHYLDVQFRLIREDFIDPLRRGLNQYLAARLSAPSKLRYKYEGLRFYPKCIFEKIEKTEKSQLAFLLNFDVDKKIQIQWEYSKRFMFGSLLLFTSDGFKTFFYGTVSQRDTKILSQGKLFVTFPENVEADKNFFSKEYLMAESEVFFEPYFLVMKSLKTFDEKNFPMKKYIVDGGSEPDWPSYLSNDMAWKIFENTVNPFETYNWPTPEELSLDEFQHRAFVKALTSDFCVIQGPPGTGKTFIGLKIVQVLLENISKNHKQIRSPILIVCFTNHALDQFLEGILRFTEKIIRVGSQSKSELLKDFNLRGRNQYNIRKSALARRQIDPALLDIRFTVKKNYETVDRLTTQKSKLEKPCGILKYQILSTVMTEYQKVMLPDSKTLLDWLLEGQNEEKCSTTGPKFFNKKDNDGSQQKPKYCEEETIEVEGDEDDAEDDHLVDEDDVFQMDETTKQFFNSDSFYELTIEEIGVRCKELDECSEELKELPDEEIEDLAAHYNNLQALEEEFETLARRFLILEEKLSEPNLIAAKKNNTLIEEDICVLSFPERWTLYWSWVKKLRDDVVKDLQQAEETYRNSLVQYEEFKQIEDLFVVQQSDIVGMTTTCAARLHQLLNSLKPAIVIVEEAAEVLETHIVTSLTKSCEQVILIGDHKQLKPNSAVYELSKNYNIDVSLFERMINNGMECPMLNVQHRMRPEISSLITPLIYPDLKNDPKVCEFQNVKGIKKNLFFLEHNNYEESVEDSSSRKNVFEAEFLIELCKYLILQGYDPEKITLLTTYTGQMFLLRQKKRNHQLLKNVKCVVVDKYQGEENDIILLSLVRSNEEAKIGFLKTKNRVCVALSRAKMGFYIVGNMDNLAKSSPDLWGVISENLRKQNAIGKQITLYCPRHEVSTIVSCSKDFDKVQEGGCSNFCGELLECGHNCRSFCHTLDREHQKIKCRELCQRMCARDLHKCEKSCFQECGQCTHKIKWTLDCGHEKTLSCWVEEAEYQCNTVVEDVSPWCGHAIERKCHENPADVACQKKCEDRLRCGHACTLNCHKNLDPDHEEYKCKKPCDRTNQNCSREHKCKKLCFQECGMCSVRVTFNLECEHQIRLSCSTNIDEIKCYKECTRLCQNCNKKCRKKCYEDCFPCKNETEKRIEDCGHQVRVQCHLQAERKHCTEQCERLLECGHKCMAKCRETCGSKICQELVVRRDVSGICEHEFVNVPCFLRAEPIQEKTRKEALAVCDARCKAELSCGDRCGGTCGKCWQGRLHEPCQKNCGSINICGHSCKYPCRQSCPPCEEPCGYRCKHSKCTKKCGVPCVKCTEPCEWNCPHKFCNKKCWEICDRDTCNEACPEVLLCGHKCIGFCGEPCPPKCRVCNPEITEIIFGFEDEENARFVFLEDCEHTIESKALDMHLSTTGKGREIVMQVCPLCKTPITKTLRYMNSVKRAYNDILKVKSIIFGDQKTLTNKRKELHNDIVRFIVASKRNIEATGLRQIHTMAQEYRLTVNVKKKNENPLSSTELNTINFFYRILVDIDSRLGSLCEEDSLLKTYQLHDGPATLEVIEFVKALLGRMRESAFQISRQQSEDFALELRRYHKMVDYSLVFRNPSYICRKNYRIVNNMLADAKYLILGIQRYDCVETVLNEIFEKLERELETPVPLTMEEKMMINKAMSRDFFPGNSQGHWYTCSNGHYYVVTECGGAMVKSNCPECGEVIGGENHVSVETARLATDMDGATQPACHNHGENMRQLHEHFQELLDD